MKRGKDKLPRTISDSNYQLGGSIMEVDMKRVSLPPGKRISKNRRIYTENRKNRSDKKGTKL